MEFRRGETFPARDFVVESSSSASSHVDQQTSTSTTTTTTPSLIPSKSHLQNSNKILNKFNKKRMFLEKYYGEVLEYSENENIENDSSVSEIQPENLHQQSLAYYENEESLNSYEHQSDSLSDTPQKNSQNPVDLEKYLISDNYKSEFIPQLSSLNLENKTMNSPCFNIDHQQVGNRAKESYSDLSENKDFCRRPNYFSSHYQSNGYEEELDIQRNYEQHYSDFSLMSETFQGQEEICPEFWSCEEPLDLSVPKDDSTTLSPFSLCSEYDEAPSECSLKEEFGDQNSWLKKIKTGTRSRVRSPKSWEFLLRLLMDPKSNPSMIRWEDESTGTFRLVQKDEIAKIWGMRSTKHKDGGLSYDNFARNLRYHYKTKMLVPVSEKHLVYKFSNEVMEKKHSFLN